jgi:putative hydrolase of the HAD superfamily
MSLRAVIFDIYGTLLEVGPPPTDAAARWEHLWRETFGTAPRLTLARFSVACDEIIAREHALASARWIPFPEICWPAVAAETLPELHGLSATSRDEFLFQQARLWHTTRMTAEAASALRWLQERSCLLGIASNAQAYTRRELREGLETHGLEMDLFEPGLCFWSYEHGFSKPDPHVFQILSARLAMRSISPSEVLMVGDRVHHDIVPAKNHGWLAWHLTSTPTEMLDTSGDWTQFMRYWKTQI